MGCDIAIYIEEEKEPNKWVEVEVKPGNILPEERHYPSWGFLFGVRRDDYQDRGLFGLRGLPDNFSIKEVKEDFENTYSDWHSYSYLTWEEVEKIEWPEHLKDCYFKIFLDEVFPRMISWPDKKIRMIVCFHS